MTNTLDGGVPGRPALTVIEGGGGRPREPLPPLPQALIPGVAITLSGFMAVDLFSTYLGDAEDLCSVMRALDLTVRALRADAETDLGVVIEKWGRVNTDSMTVGVFAPPDDDPSPPASCG